jgi:F-type H+-transporting ATPase subunit b|uniref:ATP synthase CF0 subunit I n=1 Tax=Proboscia sp. TaxID=1923967 RepID=A0A2U9NM43_9STRA|nr:ATP synthase CF0 subunit I [Proboscia sp.]AWT38216.1 ATP synthase CF0 subunit I [Proboscia sp.]
MENFDQTFILLAQSEGISLNFDILESGLLNIIALVGILIYSGRDFLSPLLEARKNEISSSVEDAQERRDEAFLSWAIAETQLDQVTVLISEITEQTVLIKKSLLKTDVDQSKKDLTVRFGKALTLFRSKEQQIFLEVKQQIISLVLKQTAIRAQQTFAKKESALNLINDAISSLYL